MTSIKKSNPTNIGEDLEGKELSYTVGGNVTYSSPMEISMEVPQKINYRTPK
jgi:hypothetical protein